MVECLNWSDEGLDAWNRNIFGHLTLGPTSPHVPHDPTCPHILQQLWTFSDFHHDAIDDCDYDEDVSQDIDQFMPLRYNHSSYLSQPAAIAITFGWSYTGAV